MLVYLDLHLQFKTLRASADPWSTAMEQPQKSFPIKQMFAQLIFENKKRFEIRPLRKLYQVQAPALIAFHWYSQERLMTRVVGIKQFRSVKEALQELTVQKVLPGWTFKDAMEFWQQAV